MATKKPIREKMIQVAVRMTPAQWRKVQAAAKAGKESFSEYVRRQCGVNP